VRALWFCRGTFAGGIGSVGPAIRNTIVIIIFVTVVIFVTFVIVVIIVIIIIVVIVVIVVRHCPVWVALWARCGGAEIAGGGAFVGASP
jgi:hypothetical protein